MAIHIEANMTKELLDSVERRLDTKHSALLVIDMQNDFCAEGGYVEKVVGKDVAACRAVVAPIMSLVAAARTHRVPVIWIKANYDPQRVPEGMLAKQREKSQVVCCSPGSWGHKLYGVESAPDETVIEKHSFSAFTNTQLEQALREKGVRTVVFAGVQTNVCVESSLRDAVCRGFYAVLASDCVASHTPPLHEATLKNVQFLFGDVLDRAAITTIWGKAGTTSGA